MAAPMFTPLDHEVFFVVAVFSLSSLLIYALIRFGKPYALFFYNCFLKPFSGKEASGRDQQSALESFYKGQAAIYDATRSHLLRGREDMLALAAAQLRLKNEREGFRKRVWVDIGGGTGYNIELLNQYMTVPDHFSQVYLVDLSPSLCAVAEKRFEKLGWTNVKVLCTDARRFKLPSGDLSDELFSKDLEGKADWISMSYSLSMIPDFFSVIDSLSNLLAPNGLISVADFYVQAATTFSNRTYTGGFLDRHVNWFSRQFWRMWFEFDRVNLDEGRRDYMEYKFGTVLSINDRNNLFGGIPYYVWLGCHRNTSYCADAITRVDAAATESPYLSPQRFQSSQQAAVASVTAAAVNSIRSKGFEAAILNLSANLPLPSFFYQNSPWRIYYDELLSKHTQFKNSYIYSFNWEDPRVDERLLKINSEDTILAITSAGDNILSYILNASPRRIHAVDLNPAQNHLLELKLAAFTVLEHHDIWKIFGSGHHEWFRAILTTKLSPYLSSQAFQFWLDNAGVFTSSGGLYESGHSGVAIKTTKWLFRVFRLNSAVTKLCNAQTLNEQREIWRDTVRPVMLSKWVSRGIIGNERFLWKALGVPPKQRDMIVHDYLERNGGKGDSRMAMWEYVVNTLDPVIENSMIGEENYFYLLCLKGGYTKRCHPGYLSEKAHRKLSTPGIFDGVRIHTDELNEVLARIKPETLTIAVVMDSMDWFDPAGTEAREQIRGLNNAMKIGGRVLLRSAGITPWYISVFEEEGFSAKRVAARNPGGFIDRVNMYISTWVVTKRERYNRTEETATVKPNEQ